jgi:transcriptional adapter 2-alpha
MYALFDVCARTDLKLKVLEIYNSKLDARAERKKFILQRGLLERRDKKRSKEEKEVYNNMRVFARFHTDDEHEQFVQGLISISLHFTILLYHMTRQRH